MKNGNESWDVLGDSRKRYRCPRAETGKYEKKKKTNTVRATNIYEVYIRTAVMASSVGGFYADFMCR